MKLTVLVPTYRRSQDLARCLAALQQQTRLADEILIVVREEDRETSQFFAANRYPSLGLRLITVTVPGQVAALNAGLDAARGDVIAITDDDAAPHPYWLERIEAHFRADDRLGGLGGRDWVYTNGQLIDASVHPGASDTVGRLQWFGRSIGNHHICTGKAREVDILKGANMSFRRTALDGLRFDSRLKGTGAQVCNDMGFSLAVKKAGWKLVYDPQVAVDHYPAQRFDEDQRNQFNAVAQVNLAHNETLVTLENLAPYQRVAFLIWSTLVGTRSIFGVVQLIRFLARERTLAIQKWVASMQGRWQGWQTWWRSRTKNQHGILVKSGNEFNNAA
ncbi:glycosyltransferase family 2 protein [Leptodesmis sichuanensis]|uniref:glycosyltransferase family 2 protein n=1 Tax=Leptodesmis sichuanensis TaxID=2906798 RepID=UPI001F47D0B5|nr:glycosyltransferase family 2 protein [Leptodesmis sichuanensis]UIE38668.1 glycosyltransferase [Leptodesmis sichuanensis A121]